MAVLGTEPSLVSLYSTRYGQQQLFQDAGLSTPPSVYQIFSLEQLVEGLAWLVVNNLLVQRWLFKIDHHIHGRGIGRCYGNVGIKSVTIAGTDN